MLYVYCIGEQLAEKQDKPSMIVKGSPPPPPNVH